MLNARLDADDHDGKEGGDLRRWGGGSERKRGWMGMKRLQTKRSIEMAIFLSFSRLQRQVRLCYSPSFKRYSPPPSIKKSDKIPKKTKSVKKNVKSGLYVCRTGENIVLCYIY